MRKPKYRRFAPRNIAFVEWQGKRHYFSGFPYGTKESWSAYLDFCKTHCVDGRPVQPKKRGAKRATSILVVDLAERFLEHALDYYGTGRTERAQYRRILGLAVERFGHLPIDELGPLKFAALRDYLATTEQVRIYRNKRGEETTRRSTRLKRDTINHLIADLKRVFKWGVTQELVSAEQWMAIHAVPGLRAGRSAAPESQPRKPVEWKDVEAILGKVSKVVAAMVRLQWLTGCRPQNVCLLRPMEIDCSVQPWVWTPAHHKAKWRGQDLTMFLGPQSQEVLRPFINRDVTTFCFQPRESNGKTSKRAHYHPDTYAKAILYGIASLVEPRVEPPFSRAKFDAAGLTYWTPHQLRHARATAIREQYGLEAAQAVLGHASLAATQIYAKRRLDLAREIATECG